MERLEPYIDAVPYQDAELMALRMTRGITKHPASWDSLIAVANRLLGHFQNEPTVIEQLYDESVALPLIAAARLFYGAAGAAVSENDDAEYARAAKILGWLAAAAFAAHGNFPAARACATEFSIWPPPEDSVAWTAAYALFVPSELGNRLLDIDGNMDEDLVSLLESLNAHATTGEERFETAARDALVRLLRRQPESPFHRALLRSGRLALNHQIALSMARALRAHSSLPASVAASLASTGSPTCLPPQHAAIVGGFLANRRNALVTLPTSTGKTLLAQLALLVGALRNQSTAVFVAPYVAVARQAITSFNRLTRDLPVRILSGWSPDDRLRARFGGAQIIVATPERLTEWLNEDLDIDHLETIVFDEAHLVENGVRGALLEGLITRLRLRQLAGNDVRIILMSAVLANHQQVKQWIGIDDRDHIRNDWRPTARRIAVWTQDGQLQYLFGADPLKAPDIPATRSVGSRPLPLVEPMIPTSHPGGAKLLQDSAIRNVAYLTQALLSDVGGPLLCVCMTKSATRRIARQLAASFEEIELGPVLTSLSEIIEMRYTHLRDLTQCLKHGVAYHNAALPRFVRDRIEQAVTQRELSVVTSTTTLAEGADLPFRTTVLYDWLQWVGDGKQEPISTLLFRNIVGRSGRAGSFAEGDTVVFENVVGDVQYTRQAARRQALAELVRGEPTLRSAFELAGTESAKTSIEAVFGSDFIAAIDENPGNAQLADDYLRHSYSGAVRVSGRMVTAVRGAKDDALDASSGDPIGVAASPIRLTPLGIAVRQSGLSPRTARRLLIFLAELSYTDIDLVVSALLTQAYQYPECTNAKAKKVFGSSRLGANQMIRASDMVALSRGWRLGRDLTELFAELPKTRTSRRLPTIDVWLAGESAESWDEAYDNFLDFTEFVFGTYVPMLLRACGRLTPFSTTPLQIDWNPAAIQYEQRADPEVLEL